MSFDFDGNPKRLVVRFSENSVTVTQGDIYQRFSLDGFYQWKSELAPRDSAALQTSLMPQNVVYDFDTGLITSMHNTPTLCDEESCDQWHKGNDYRWERIYTPPNMNAEQIIGSKLANYIPDCPR